MSVANPPSTSAPGVWRWIVLGSGALGLGSGLALTGYVSSLFQGPLQAEFGWTRAQIGGSFMAFIAATAVLPWIGRIVDRMGPLKVISASVVLMPLGYTALSLVRANIWSFYLAYVVTILLGLGTGPVGYARAVLPVFSDRPGIALGAILAGAGAVSLFVPPFLSWVIVDYGWRVGYRTLGVLTLILGLLAVAGLAAGSRMSSRAARAQSIPPATGFTFSAGLKSWRFWLMTTMIFIASIPSIGIVSNLQPLVVEAGVAGGSAAWLISVLAAAVVVGGLCVGWMLDAFWAPLVAAFVFLVAASGAVLICVAGHDFRALVVGVLCLGVAQGVEVELLGFFIRRYFGLRAYGGLYGSALFGYSLAIPIGGISFGLVHDHTGGYGLALIISAGLFGIAAGGTLLLGRYPQFERNLQP